MASLTRKYLASIGIEEDKIDLIMEKHSEVLTEVKDERDKYKQDAEKLPDIQKQLEDLKAKQSDDDHSELEKVKKDLADKTAEFEKYKGDIEAKETKAKKETAYRKLLKDAGINDKYLDIIVKANKDEIDSISFDKDGNVKESDKITAGMKESLSTFIVTSQQKGADVQDPPAGNNGGGEQKPSRAAELFKQHAAEMYGNKTKED